MPEGLISTGPGNYLEVRLTATDSSGLSKTVIRDVQPHRVDVSFATNPSGPSLLINGETFATPETLTLVSWEGYRLKVDAPHPRPSPYVFSALVRRPRAATRYRYRGNAELTATFGHLHSLHAEWDLKRRDP